MDLKIASICLAHDAMLLTRNVGHFKNIPGLRVENWLEETKSTPQQRAEMLSCRPLNITRMKSILAPLSLLLSTSLFAARPILCCDYGGGKLTILASGG